MSAVSELYGHLLVPIAFYFVKPVSKLLPKSFAELEYTLEKPTKKILHERKIETT